MLLGGGGGGGSVELPHVRVAPRFPVCLCVRVDSPLPFPLLRPSNSRVGHFIKAPTLLRHLPPADPLLGTPSSLLGTAPPGGGAPHSLSPCPSGAGRRLHPHARRCSRAAGALSYGNSFPRSPARCRPPPASSQGRCRGVGAGGFGLLRRAWTNIISACMILIAARNAQGTNVSWHNALFLRILMCGNGKLQCMVPIQRNARAGTASRAVIVPCSAIKLGLRSACLQ